MRRHYGPVSHWTFLSIRGGAVSADPLSRAKARLSGGTGRGRVYRHQAKPGQAVHHHDHHPAFSTRDLPGDRPGGKQPSHPGALCHGPHFAAAGAAVVLQGGAGQRHPRPGVGRFDGGAAHKIDDEPPAPGPDRFPGKAGISKRIRRVLRPGGPVRGHGPRFPGRSGPAHRQERVLICGYPLLPHPLRLLQLCQPERGKEHEAHGPVFRRTAAGGRRHCPAGPGPGAGAYLPVHGRRHAHDSVRRAAGPSVFQIGSGIRPVAPAGEHRGGRTPSQKRSWKS